jgi:hypothetical protein
VLAAKKGLVSIKQPPIIGVKLVSNPIFVMKKLKVKKLKVFCFFYNVTWPGGVVVSGNLRSRSVSID